MTSKRKWNGPTWSSAENVEQETPAETQAEILNEEGQVVAYRTVEESEDSEDE